MDLVDMVMSVLRVIIGLVVEFVVAIDEARVRFTDDALLFFFVLIFCSCQFLSPMRFNPFILYLILLFNS
ncbi:hypothetical protein N7527_006660 [Penicillium freii]|uniref:Uncharacterized protein n=1 Tax=Penicillium freii TaxID=48697 RepID=A0A101MIK7_PENFR|nr:hypothetical protein N7527_006660 [Penicillium freii]KUM61261.1 hypothetical protein ACN42_g5837 [Penicillium freii]